MDITELHTVEAHQPIKRKLSIFHYTHNKLTFSNETLPNSSM